MVYLTDSSNSNKSPKKMRRRKFLKIIAASLFCGSISAPVLADMISLHRRQLPPERLDRHIKDYLHKMRRFDTPHENDRKLGPPALSVLPSCLKRLKNIQRTVGHGNFHLLNFDEAKKIASSYSRVGSFPKAELDLLEMLFYEDASAYGFYGEKPLSNMTDRVDRSKIVKIPGSGNYLYKGHPVETYKKIKQDVGEQAILTSGVRGIVKQFLLFLNKTHRNNGNLSLASRSLAPPGYSFHGIGDFDMGQIDYGAANFTEEFENSKVYQRLSELGYIRFRYNKNNMLGVRYEPWHITVANIA